MSQVKVDTVLCVNGSVLMVFLHARALLAVSDYQPHGWDIRRGEDLLHGGGSVESWVELAQR